MNESGTPPVAAVEQVWLLEKPGGRLRHFTLDAPVAGAGSEGHAIEVAGSLVVESAPAERVEVLQVGVPVLVLPVHAGRFAGSLGTLRVPASYDLEVRAVLADGDVVPLARIRGRRRGLQGTRTAEMQPLILMSLGRTGSTWLTWLLHQHPEIYCYRPFAFDVRAGSYWMTVLQRLSDPAGALRQVLPGDPLEDEWWAGTAGLRSLEDPLLERWLALDGVNELAEMAAGRIQSLYAQMPGSGGSRFFLEKHAPGQLTTDLITEIFAGAREVVLVRDLRDLICSVLAFNQKRGYQAFGRDVVASDEEYVELIRVQGQALLDRWRDRGDDAWLVRYEDLIRDPAGTLPPMLRFLGLDEHLADEMIEGAAREFGVGMQMHITAPDPSASIGRWRSDLDDSLKDLCARALGPLHEAFGYPAEGH